MTLFFDTLRENHLGYAAIFACIGVGFFFLHKANKGEVGPGYWSLSFFLNSVGFLFWSGSIPLVPWQFFLAGEVFHIAGFFALVVGAYRFAGHTFKRWNLFSIGSWVAVWILALLLIPHFGFLASLLLKVLRAILFIAAGVMILRHTREKTPEGRNLAGWSLVAWGVYLVLFAFWRVNTLLHLAFGFLVGFQILAAFGLVVMVVDRIRIRAEESEKLAKRLEGLLPICSFCKRIRDENDEWRNVETYIEERSQTEFSHGICPECAKKNYAEVLK
jgi:hypothetical protein